MQILLSLLLYNIRTNLSRDFSKIPFVQNAKIISYGSSSIDVERSIIRDTLSLENASGNIDLTLVKANNISTELRNGTVKMISVNKNVSNEENEFLKKYNNSGMSFDSFLSFEYINLLPTSIRNFFWFLRTIRHGITLNALASLEIYDEFSIEFLKTNLMIFEVAETLYVQDYFLQKIDIPLHLYYYL